MISLKVILHIFEYIQMMKKQILFAIFSISLSLFVIHCKTEKNSKITDPCENRDLVQMFRLFPDNDNTGNSHYVTDSGISVEHDTMILRPWPFFNKNNSLSSLQSNYLITHNGKSNDDSFVFIHSGPGFYSFKVKPTGCKQIVISKSGNIDCNCNLISDSAYHVLLEIVDTVHVLIKKLQYIPVKKLGCTYDFPADPCPDLSPVFSAKNIHFGLPVLWDFDNSKKDTAQWINSKPVTIYNKYQSMTLKISEYDRVGDNDVLFKISIGNADVNNWNTGIYKLSGGEIILEIERLP